MAVKNSYYYYIMLPNDPVEDSCVKPHTSYLFRQMFGDVMKERDSNFSLKGDMDITYN